MLIDPLNISSTPVAILSKIGLKTSVGVSSDDPKKERNLNLHLYVILSVYCNSKLESRKIIDTLKPNTHKFYDLDEELQKLNLTDTADFCVLHRVPTHLFPSGEILEQLEANEIPDFDMYRMVVQYTSNKNNKGSVIYETPPNFNYNKNRSDFLSFSNKIYLSDEVENNLVFINYSTNRSNETTAEITLKIYGSNGENHLNKSLSVKPFSYTAININSLKINTKEKFLTFTAASGEASLIPLSVSLCLTNGGVSVEHSHPPQAYMMAPWATKASIKKNAIKALG